MGAIAVAVDRGTYKGGSWTEQMAFRACWVNVTMVENPTIRLHPVTDDPYFVAYTEELSVIELAYMGNFARKIKDIPGGYEVPLLDPEGDQKWSNVDWKAMRPQIRNFCKNIVTVPPLVLPGDPGWPSGDESNFYQAVLDANGAPGWILASDRIPKTWGYPA